MIDHTIRNKVRVANSHGLATVVTVAAQTTVLLLGLILHLSLPMGHGPDRSDPSTHVDRSEILTRP